jgi:hypothetical protein
MFPHHYVHKYIWTSADRKAHSQSHIYQVLMLSCDGVTIDGVWIGNQIYWTLEHTTHDYTLQITITPRLVFSVTVYTVRLVAASNGGRSSSSGFPNCTWLQLLQLPTDCLPADSLSTHS